MSQPRNGTPGDVEEIHWPSLVAAVSSISAVGIAIGLGLPLLSIILEKRGISSTLIGLNTAMAGIAAMAAAPITTKLAHKYGVAPTMMWAVLISALSALGFYYAQDFWMWFPLRFAFHGATTTLFILSEFWINAASPPSKRGFVLGIYATVLSLGFAAGPLIFSLLGSDGILPFLVGAFAILLAAIPIFIARHESPVLDEKPELHFMRYVFLVPTATAAVFIFGAVEAGGLSLFPIFAVRAHFTETQAALLLTMMGVGNVIFQIPLGLLSDRIKDKRPLLALMALTGFVGTMMLPVLVNNWILMAGLLLFWGRLRLRPLHGRSQPSRLAADRFGPCGGQCGLRFLLCRRHRCRPQVIGAAIDVAGNNGFAYAIAGFFGLYALLAGIRLLFLGKRA